jgi:hypothetical protein
LRSASDVGHTRSIMSATSTNCVQGPSATVSTRSANCWQVGTRPTKAPTCKPFCGPGRIPPKNSGPRLGFRLTSCGHPPLRPRPPGRSLLPSMPHVYLPLPTATAGSRLPPPRPALLLHRPRVLVRLRPFRQALMVKGILQRRSPWHKGLPLPKRNGILRPWQHGLASSNPFTSTDSAFRTRVYSFSRSPCSGTISSTCCTLRLSRVLRMNNVRSQLGREKKRSGPRKRRNSKKHGNQPNGNGKGAGPIGAGPSQPRPSKEAAGGGEPPASANVTEVLTQLRKLLPPGVASAQVEAFEAEWQKAQEEANQTPDPAGPT